MDIYFQDLDIVAVVLGGVVFLFFAIQLYYYSHYFSGVIRKNRKDKQGRTIFNFAQPPRQLLAINGDCRRATTTSSDTTHAAAGQFHHER